MSQHPAAQALADSLKQAYHQVVDADNFLQSQSGKFSQIFNDEEGFATQANRLQPYLLEVAERAQSLDWQNNAAVSQITAQLALILRTAQQINHMAQQQA